MRFFISFTITHTAQSEAPPAPIFLLPEPVQLNFNNSPSVALLQVVACLNNSNVTATVLSYGVAFAPTDGIVGIQSNANAVFVYLNDSNALGMVSGNVSGNITFRCRDPTTGNESVPASSSFIFSATSPYLQGIPDPISINTTVPIGQNIFQLMFQHNSGNINVSWRTVLFLFYVF